MENQFHESLRSASHRLFSLSLLVGAVHEQMVFVYLFALVTDEVMLCCVLRRSMICGIAELFNVENFCFDGI